MQWIMGIMAIATGSVLLVLGITLVVLKVAE